MKSKKREAQARLEAAKQMKKLLEKFIAGAGYAVKKAEKDLEEHVDKRREGQRIEGSVHTTPTSKQQYVRIECPKCAADIFVHTGVV